MPDRIFYNILPKSGTHLIKQHRGVAEDNHVSLYLGLKEYPTADDYIKHMKLIRGDFTGHVPYSQKVKDYLWRNDIRHIFVFRNLRDVAASLAWYISHSLDWRIEPENYSEFNLEIEGIQLEYREDVISDCIRIVAEWWQMFKPWLKEADNLFTYEELRPSAFLTGNEDTITFHKGRINNWACIFEPHHIDLADELLPDVIADYFSGRIFDEQRFLQAV